MVHLYSADRAEPLVRRLAEVLVDEPGDPMRPEWLAVPSDGMRRWVLLELARHLGATGPGTSDGIAANFVRAYPGTLRDAVLDATGGGGPDPWQIDRMVWPLLTIFDRAEREGRLARFTRLPRGGSRFTRARAVADLFDRYHLHRPEMIRAWADGDAVDGTLEAVDEHAAWQVELWTLLRVAIGSASPPERMPDALSELRAGRITVDLPERLVFFGFSTLPGRGFLELVDAVGTRHDVSLFLLEPHRYDPDALVRAWPTPSGPRPRLRSADRSVDPVRHPLLRSWGRLPRETALLLADARAQGLPTPTALGPDGDRRPGSLLHRLQEGLRADAPPEWSEVAPDDRSVQFHACFGPRREVEVARDAILHVLDTPGSGLTEEDVLVVCPGLERFAPLIEAAFGPAGTVPAPSGPGPHPPRLRYRIADRSIRTANPVLGATAALLELVSGRFELADVLDFLSLAPVRERFRFDDRELAVLTDWAEQTSVRWGLDAVHRSRFGVPEAVVGNTWQRALDRLLFGSVTSDGGARLAIGRIAPYGVDSGDAELLGSLAFVLGRLASLVEFGGGPDGPVRHPLGEWVTEVRGACRDLLRPPARATWQSDALDQMFLDLLDTAGDAASTATTGLDLLDVRRLVDTRLDGEPGRPDFFRGGVTVTSMTPLRWVPFRVVCVLGLDQEAVVSSSPDAADLVASAPQVGDPDPRAEFRQSILEAVLAAQDHLILVRDGRDVRSGHEVPRVVPAAELLDVAVALGAGPSPEPGVRGLEVVHPRHPFDEPCLTHGALVPGQVWSFDPDDLEGARGRRSRPDRRQPFLSTPLDRPPDGLVDLVDLRAFLADPVAHFVSRSLDAGLPRGVDELDAALPVELGGLEVHRLGVDLVDARSAGVTDEQWLDVARAKGLLPPGVLEARAAGDLIAEIDELVAEAAARGFRSGEPTPFSVDVTLASGCRIVGEVPLQLGGDGPGPARVTFTRPKPVNRLDAWIQLMVLVASDPTVAWRSLVVTRADKKGKPLVPVDLVVPVPEDEPDPAGYRRRVALDALEVMVDLYHRGMREPLPLFPAYSPAEYAGGTGHEKWESFDGRGDATGTAVRLVFGDMGAEELETLPTGPGDPDDGRGTTGRAARYARLLWGAVDATVEQVP